MVQREDMADADDAVTTMTASTRKGVLLDEHHYFSEDERRCPPNQESFPRARLLYQAAVVPGGRCLRIGIRPG